MFEYKAYIVSKFPRHSNEFNSCNISHKIPYNIKIIYKTYKKYYTTLIKTMHIKYNYSQGKSPELRHAQSLSDLLFCTRTFTT